MSAAFVTDLVCDAVACLLKPGRRLTDWAVGCCWPARCGEHERCDDDRWPTHHRHGSCNCEIPPPCWIPVRLDDVGECVEPGNTGVIRLGISNCGAVARTFSISTNNPGVTIDPPSLTLGPLERAVSVLALDVPATATEHDTEDVVVSVGGCKDYTFRWTVLVGCCRCERCRDERCGHKHHRHGRRCEHERHRHGRHCEHERHRHERHCKHVHRGHERHCEPDCCHCRCSGHREVEIFDEPDYVHHWYDHFYCEHPCSRH
jgi:hypothetical protein